MKEAGGRQEEVAKEKKKSVERANAERERAVMAKREMVAEEEKERAEWERLRKKMIQREKLQRLEAATKTLGEMIREGLGGWDASEVGD
ncbi:hypothetical protein MMC34_003602 [Xylographa carneopallida]|nr:hypothetical protein [Xylographa carneopallida]